MIKLNKGQKPVILAQNADDWRDELLAILNAGDEPSDYLKGRYNQPEVKAALREETSDKCAYCESKVPHVAWGDIEHILPRKEAPELSFEWDNLTFACQICNNRKRAYFDEECPLIDPYDDDPEAEIMFFGFHAYGRPGQERAEVTERTLDLNRAELIERRKARLDNLLKLVALLQSTQTDAKRQILKDDFAIELGDDREYTSMAREIARRFDL